MGLRSLDKNLKLSEVKTIVNRPYFSLDFNEMGKVLYFYVDFWNFKTKRPYLVDLATNEKFFLES